MKFMHLADLHLGKSVNGFSMIEDQREILRQIIEIADNEWVNAVLISGDIYDRQVPSEEAVRLMNSFITELADGDRYIFMIYGNHDSAGRTSFASGLLSKNRVYISPVFDGKLTQVMMNDRYGDICVTLLPFVRPSSVYRAYAEDDGGSDAGAVRDGNYDEAFGILKSHISIDRSIRNIILSHQFVTGSVRCDSEDVTVGGLDSIDSAFFDDFDYAALGHLHGPQRSGRDTVRYAGSPLKYSFSEEKQNKSVPIVEMCEKGSTEIKLVSLKPVRDMRTVKGTFSELCAVQKGTDPVSLDYIRAVLFDETDIPDAVAKLRHIYPNIMCMEYDNTRTRNLEKVYQTDDSVREKKEPLDYISELYRIQNGKDMTAEQKKMAVRILESADIKDKESM